MKAKIAAQLVSNHGADKVCKLLAPFVSDKRQRRIDEVLAQRLASVTVVFENLHDPHNGAAALRSVEAFGLTHAHLIGNQDLPSNSDMAQGADKWIHVHKHASVDEAFAKLAADGFLSVATSPRATMRISDLPSGQKYALWLGNEHAGLSNAAQERCHHSVAIPMSGFVESLNLSVSTALCTHLLSERRRAELGQRGDLSETEISRLRAQYWVQSVREPAAILAKLSGIRSADVD